MHHGMMTFPDGNILAMGVELREVAKYPTTEAGPAPRGPADVVGDTLYEFQPDGTVLKSRSLFAVLDESRTGYDGVNGDHWHGFFGMDVKDWSHANGVTWDEANNLVIISLRHQDAVVALDRSSGALRWILGPHDNWEPAWADKLLEPVGEGFAWQWHQHGPAITALGTIVMLDNGNYRAAPYDPKTLPVDNFSRVVEYRVDEATMTVEQVWQYGEGLDPALYSGSLGNAVMLPETENVMVCFGNLALPLPDSPRSRIMQVTHATPALVVSEFTGPFAARQATHMPTLYPPE
jgi:hypothetical protein